MAKKLGPQNQVELSAILEVSLSTVKQWTVAGCPRRKDGLYDLPSVIDWLRKRERESAKSKRTAPGDLETERARLAKEQADKLELENAIMRREYIHKDDVAAALEPVVMAIRSSLLGDFAYLWPRLKGLTRDAEAQSIIDGRNHERLNALAEIDPGSFGESAPGDPEPPGSVSSSAAADRKPVGRRVPKTQPGKRRRTRAVGHRAG